MLGMLGLLGLLGLLARLATGIGLAMARKLSNRADGPKLRQPLEQLTPLNPYGVIFFFPANQVKVCSDWNFALKGGVSAADKHFGTSLPSAPGQPWGGRLYLLKVPSIGSLDGRPAAIQLLNCEMRPLILTPHFILVASKESLFPRQPTSAPPF